MIKKRLLGIAIVLFLWDIANAQIYSQGKNLNELKAFFINVELVKAPLDPSKYLAKVDFYGKRKDVEWYLTSGSVRKSFNDNTELITYLENNEWYFLMTEVLKSKSNVIIRERYSFRKSMDRLKEDQDEQVSLLDN